MAKSFPLAKCRRRVSGPFRGIKLVALTYDLQGDIDEMLCVTMPICLAFLKRHVSRRHVTMHQRVPLWRVA
jgi:hypothetical protein